MVTEIFLYGLDVISTLQGGDSVGVAQVMESDIWISGGCDKFFEIQIYRLWG